MSQVAHQAGAHHGFRDMKRLGGVPVPQHYILQYPFLYLGERGTVSSKNTTQWPLPGLEPGPLDPETSSINMTPLTGKRAAPYIY